MPLLIVVLMVAGCAGAVPGDTAVPERFRITAESQDYATDAFGWNVVVQMPAQRKELARFADSLAATLRAATSSSIRSPSTASTHPRHRTIR